MLDWLKDFDNLASLSSIFGLLVTIFLFCEARKIQKSFLRRARLPEINKDLVKSTSQLASHLKQWADDKNPTLETFSKVKALLESIKPRLSSNEKKKVDAYLSNLYPKKYCFVNGPLSSLTEDEAWERYTELTGVVTALQQSAKDLKWD